MRVSPTPHKVTYHVLFMKIIVVSLFAVTLVLTSGIPLLSGGSIAFARCAINTINELT